MEVITVLSQIRKEIRSFEEEIAFYNKKIEFLEDMYSDLEYRLSVAGYDVENLFEDDEDDEEDEDVFCDEDD